LIRLLVTNAETRKTAQSLSFVVGDADQSIYSFRLADFTILHQQDFGDGLPDEDTARW